MRLSGLRLPVPFVSISLKPKTIFNRNSMFVWNRLGKIKTIPINLIVLSRVARYRGGVLVRPHSV